MGPDYGGEHAARGECDVERRGHVATLAGLREQRTHRFVLALPAAGHVREPVAFETPPVIVVDGYELDVARVVLDRCQGEVPQPLERRQAAVGQSVVEDLMDATLHLV